MIRKRIVAYLLLAVVALLVAAWIANFFGQFGIGTRSGKFDYHYTFRSGNLSLSQHDNSMLQGLFWRTYPPLPEFAADVGTLSSLSAHFRFTNIGAEDWFIQVPIIVLITVLLPFVLGSFLGFRFPLWQFFAFTAIVAVELACFVKK